MNRILIFIATYRHNPITLLTASTQAHEHGADLLMSRNNPYAGDKAGLNILHQYRLAQEHANNYDYVMTIEDDMIIPHDALNKLLGALQMNDASAVYGVYHFRRLSLTGNITDKKTGVSIGVKEWTKAYKAQSVIECGGIGYGCTLFDARVFAQIPLETRNGSGGDSDTHLGEWMRKNERLQLAHFGVQCGHIREDGSVLYVGDKPNNPIVFGELKRTFSRVRVLRDFAGRDVNGAIFVHRAGDTVEIDSELAQTYAPAGIVEYIKGD